MVVLGLATSVVGQTVDFVITDVHDDVGDCGTPKVQIGYVNNGVPAEDLPVGMSLLVVVENGSIAALDSADPCDFLVYLDAASDDPENYDIGDGTPLAADPCAPGELTTFPATQAVICMARLDTDAPGPNPGPAGVVNLVTLELQNDNPNADILVNLYVNEKRGGVIGASGILSTNLPMEDAFIGPPLAWQGTYGQSQCKGDYSGATGMPDGAVNSSDFLALKSAYGSNYGDANYDPGCDSDRNGAINSTDFLDLKNNYGTSPTGCQSGCPFPNSWPPE